MAGVAFDGCERIVDGGASYGVVDDVEALTCGVPVDVLFGGKCAVVDGGCTELFDYVLLVCGDGGEYLCTEGLCELHGDVSDSARACVDEHLLAGVDFGTIDDAFPRGDRD